MKDEEKIIKIGKQIKDFKGANLTKFQCTQLEPK